MKVLYPGRYCSKDTRIHRLDPRIKTMWAITLALLGLLSDRSLSIVLPVFICVLSAFLSDMKPSNILRGIMPAVYITLFAFFFTLLFSHRRTAEGALYCITLFLRISTALAASNILTYTTKPLDISFASEYGLRWTSCFGLSGHDIAMCTGLVVHFIPVLCDEAMRIAEAQKARGADFSGRGVLKKIRCFLCVIVPLFAGSLRRASVLAEAMDSRLYGTHTVISIHERKFSREDRRLFILYFIFVAQWVILRVFS